ncbi:hypothetical protein [Vitiosangium sp. GDMCC 1.1324]|uniref:hypothetical protein n=1 Tax=Vitiosangium sp. (strain GDMCC 1.1324) TaxID=2138576 RepID=UPI000D3A80F1|nr:hypothetical protein [Vitiosangium sp. GDMCC 1.1324]PTL85560.1 hypothetical protein DAT35_02260 [Vitiosangium sp. GDMCC 1.1324]
MTCHSPIVVALTLAIAAGASSCISASDQSHMVVDPQQCDGPLGSPAQLQTPVGASEGPSIDAPAQCYESSSGMDRGAYIRIHGHGTRRLVMGSANRDRACVPPASASPDVCPEVLADAVGQMIFGMLQERGIQVNGIGAGVCAQREAMRSQDVNDWNFSVGIMNWKDADTAIAIVDEVLRNLGIGDSFGISVRGIDCNSVPL